jgi:hypothetical protein
VPPCSLSSAWILPPCVSIMLRLIESPMPIPSDLALKKGEKSSSRASGEMPAPVSCTSTSMNCTDIGCGLISTHSPFGLGRKIDYRYGFTQFLQSLAQTVGMNGIPDARPVRRARQLIEAGADASEVAVHVSRPHHLLA